MGIASLMFPTESPHHADPPARKVRALMERSTMTQESLRDHFENLLREAHQTTALGRWEASFPSGTVPPADSESPNPLLDGMEFLFKETSTLEALVLRLASEVDSLRAT